MFISYAVSPVKIRTPMMLIAKSSGPLPRNILTTDAMIKPIRPMKRNEPMPVKSRLVRYPYAAAPAYIPAAITNTWKMLPRSYARKITLNDNPFTSE